MWISNNKFITLDSQPVKTQIIHNTQVSSSHQTVLTRVSCPKYCTSSKSETGRNVRQRCVKTLSVTVTQNDQKSEGTIDELDHRSARTNNTYSLKCRLTSQVAKWGLKHFTGQSTSPCLKLMIKVCSRTCKPVMCCFIILSKLLSRSSHNMGLPCLCPRSWSELDMWSYFIFIE